MTGEDLRALSAAATPGPWVAEGKNVLAADEQGLAILAAMCPLGADAELIVWLRNHADALANLIDAAEDANFCDLAFCSMCRTLRDALAALEAAP